jgi:hypothetical protein
VSGNDIDIKFSGAVFDGRAADDIERMAAEVQSEIAKRAEQQWQQNMTGSFRHATGRYQSHVNIARRDKDLVVNDGWPTSRLQYGPWLEGVGSRNSPVTRFPGYFALRRAAEKIRAEVPAIAAPIVDKWVREANT